MAARPVQRRFAYRGKFQKLCIDRGEIIGKLKLVFSTSFPRNQKQQCRNHVDYVTQIYDIPSINPPRKLMEEYCFLVLHVSVCDSSTSLNLFF